MKKGKNIPASEKILEAFVECLKEKISIDEITVAYISEKAGVGKSTFYRNYKDVYDIYEQLIDSFLGRVENLITKLFFEKSITVTELAFVFLKNGLKRDNRFFLARDAILLDYSIGMGTSRVVELVYDKVYAYAVSLAKKIGIDDERAAFGAAFFLNGNIIPIILNMHTKGRIEIEPLVLTMRIFEGEVEKWRKNR